MVGKIFPGCHDVVLIISIEDGYYSLDDVGLRHALFRPPGIG